MSTEKISDIPSEYKHLLYEANIRTKTEKLLLGKERKWVEQNIFDLLMAVVNYDYYSAQIRIENAINDPVLTSTGNGIDSFIQEDKGLDASAYATFLINTALPEETPLFIKCLLYQVIYGYTEPLVIEDDYNIQIEFALYAKTGILSLNCFRDYMDLIVYKSEHKYNYEYRNILKYQLFIRHICHMEYRTLYPKNPISNSWLETSSAIERLHSYEEQTSEDLIVLRNYVEGKSCVSLICACFEQLIIHKEFTVMKCKNCGKFFITSNSHTRYCSNPSPNNAKKTCRELQSYLSYEKLKGSISHDVKIIRDRKRVAMSRNPENKEYKDDFDKFASIQKRLRSMYRKGEISEEVYSKWINDAKTLKFTPDFDFDKLSNENS